MSTPGVARTADWRAAAARRGGHVFPVVLGDSPADVAARLPAALEARDRRGPLALAFVLLQQWDERLRRWVVCGSFPDFRADPSSPPQLYVAVGDPDDLPELGPSRPWLRRDRRCSAFRGEPPCATVVTQF